MFLIYSLYFFSYTLKLSDCIINVKSFIIDIFFNSISQLPNSYRLQNWIMLLKLSYTLFNTFYFQNNLDLSQIIIFLTMTKTIFSIEYLWLKLIILNYSCWNIIFIYFNMLVNYFDNMNYLQIVFILIYISIFQIKKPYIFFLTILY